MTSSLRTLILLALAGAVSAAGCGSDQPEGPSRPAGGSTAKAPPPTTSAEGSQPGRPPARTRAAIYARAFEKLPFHSGPLNVAQVITDETRPDMLDARVTPRSFFCGKSPEQRREAIEAYYRDVRAKVGAEGGTDVTIRVSRLRETGFVRDVYGRAQGGSVHLTAKGAGSPPAGACRAQGR